MQLLELLYGNYGTMSVVKQSTLQPTAFVGIVVIA